jgi:APA family basic amino acid/polyamine antiporter
VASTPLPEDRDTAPTQLRRSMGLGTATMVVVGGVIGSGIFLKPLRVAQSLPDAAWIHGCWIALGVVCLLGALCYAELGAMLPEAGGQYAFLRESFGPFPAFLYGWCLFLVINTGTIAALAVAFADSLKASCRWATRRTGASRSG